MKVCTDSCLFGAWIAEKIERKIIEPKTILDIGTGTGLLALMVAQKSFAKIDAVEIDEGSFLQAKENFALSQWPSRLKVFKGDIKNRKNDKKYDLIICNPPFFENDLKSSCERKNVAKHHEALTLEHLMISIKNNLAEDGNFALLLPFHRVEYFKKLAIQYNFFVTEELCVRQTPDHSCFRGLIFFTTKHQSFAAKELIIKNDEGKYTEDFNYFLREYYL